MATKSASPVVAAAVALAWLTAEVTGAWWVPTIAGFNLTYPAQELSQLLAGEPLILIPAEVRSPPEHVTPAGQALCGRHVQETARTLRQLLFGAPPDPIHRICSSQHMRDKVYTCFGSLEDLSSTFSSIREFEVPKPALDQVQAPALVKNKNSTLVFEADVHCAPLSTRGHLQWACHCRMLGAPRMRVFRSYLEWPDHGTTVYIVCHTADDTTCHPVWQGAYFYE